MDFISALSGKSPSTTGAGSEGALTKGPFNCLRPITDLNNALVSYLLTGLAGFSTPAGHIGPNVRVDHDISLLIPEIWCRLSPAERAPKFLIEEQLLEKLEDYEFQGQLIPASRLGWRITPRFIRRFAGRVFDNPNKVFDTAMLQPESQDQAAFADGVLHIAEAQRKIALRYFEDGSAELACPPLLALLHIMAHGTWNNMDAHDSEVRQHVYSRIHAGFGLVCRPAAAAARIASSHSGSDTSRPSTRSSTATNTKKKKLTSTSLHDWNPPAAHLNTSSPRNTSLNFTAPSVLTSCNCPQRTRTNALDSAHRRH
ncbi:MAG UNVERIFIED_CONTAM: hypothetical protein LVR18_08990 [Planctomycetaceae bacterium]|jgi:hypothetical protein